MNPDSENAKLNPYVSPSQEAQSDSRSSLLRAMARGSVIGAIAIGGPMALLVLGFTIYTVPFYYRHGIPLRMMFDGPGLVS